MNAPRTTGADAYRRMAADTASPLELVVMLYDGAIRFLGEARDAAARKDRRGRAHGVSKALAIIAELQSTLNMEAGAVAGELDRLYTYATQRLIDANVKRDDAAIEEVRKLMATVRAGWADVTLPRAAS